MPQALAPNGETPPKLALLVGPPAEQGSMFEDREGLISSLCHEGKDLSLSIVNCYILTHTDCYAVVVSKHLM